MMFPKIPRKVDQSALRAYRRTHTWCEVCGSTNALGPVCGGVHHILPRSRGGSDVAENLITLCGKCHTAAHQGTLTDDELRRRK